VIEQMLPPHQRQVLCECDFIDPLFAGISRLLGLPIDHIVIESRRREVEQYVAARYPASFRKAFKKLNDLADGDRMWQRAVRNVLSKTGKLFFVRVSDIGRACGFGDILPSELWEENDRYAYRVNTIRKPYSLLLYLGETLGSAEPWDLEDMCVDYEKTGDDTYRVMLSPGRHPIELADRLQVRKRAYRPGDMVFELCPGCGLPRIISHFRWDLKDGVITDPGTGRRMAIYSPASLEAILEDLEAELGETLTEAVITAQRDYVKSTYDVRDWKVRGAEGLKRELALRGLGNLTTFREEGGGVEIHIENACIHPVMVGTAQGFFELAGELKESSCAWVAAEDGDLKISLNA